MRLVITIDTEEDNWDRYSRAENPCSNIEQLLPMQELFNTFNVIPTYLVTYPVVLNKKSHSILKQFLSEGKCEIGTHCHPWNTPPFEEELSSKNTMLSNLSYDLLFKKINHLHNAIKDIFGITPSIFRSGRFGFNNNVAKILEKLGYNIDTSITPYKDWTPMYGPDFSRFIPEAYTFSADNIFTPIVNGSLVEIPPSIGYLQSNFALTNSFYKIFSRKPFRWLKIIGILNTMHLMNTVWLNPEMSTEKEMVEITRMFIKKNYSVINMTLHSNSLKFGCNKFVKTKSEEDRLFYRIKTFLQFAKDASIENFKITDVAALTRKASLNSTSRSGSLS